MVVATLFARKACCAASNMNKRLVRLEAQTRYIPIDAPLSDALTVLLFHGLETGVGRGHIAKDIPARGDLSTSQKLQAEYDIS